MSSRGSCTIYVGNLPGDVREREIEDLFYKYGRIVEIDLKLPPRPPGYCFIEFEDARDAEDAIRGRDGYSFDGHRLRVELAHGGRGSSSSFDRYNNYSSSSGRSSGVPRRSDYRVIVTGLPSSASWQDLKDHMRRAGDVCFAQVFRDRGGAMGVVDYTNYEDMKYAIQKLDDSEFRNPFSRSYIRVREDKGHGYRKSLSRSRSRSYSRSPSHEYYKRCHYGRGYTRSRSRSYSSYSDDRGSYVRSPSYSKGRSLSRSRSRSLSPSRSRSISPRSRSVSRSRSRSRSRSPSKSHSKSRSRSHSPSHSRSGSPARSPGRSLSPASNGD